MGSQRVLRRVAVVVVGMALVLSACTSDDDGSDEPLAEATPTESTDVEETPSPTPDPTAKPKPKKDEPVEPALRVLGHHDLGGGGFNGDVWAHDGFAYVGTWGGKYEEAACPAGGVKVIDISDPAKPKMAARLESPPGTSAEDVVVVHADTKSFTGDIAAVGIQACGLSEGPQTETFRGLQFFNVTNPNKPKELSRWAVAAPTPGCHEIDLIALDKRVMAGCANAVGSRFGQKEAIIVNVTDPRKPKMLSGWSLPVDIDSGVGCFSASLVHNVRFSKNGRRLYVSYWDAGTPILDIRNPRKPRLIGHVEKEPLDQDADNHSVAEAGKDLLIVLHEDLSPALPEANFGDCGTQFGPWGPLRIFDISKPSKPRLLSTFRTNGAKVVDMKNARINVVHNAEVVDGDQVFVSWYSEGVRWLDISNPKRPRQLASWVPKKARDPHNFFPDFPMIWGVYPVPDSDIILASDINSGLWVLKARGLGDR